jgi:protein-disulfide isomerase
MSVRGRLSDAFTIAALGGSLVTAAIVVRREFFPRETQQTDSAKPTPVPNWEKYIGTGRLVGRPSAPLKLVEFADFQCPECRSLHRILQQLNAEFPGQIAISYHYVPLRYHPLAYPAARAAECAAAQGRFEAYHDILFSRFDSLRADSFNEIATEAGVPDTKQFAACASRTDSVPRISADRTLAMDTLHIIGTPTVIVNAMMYAFAPPLGELRRMVKDARSHASAR